MAELPDNPVITILGAGLVGCYVGGMLTGSDNNVQFYGRKKSGEKISASGMICSSYDNSSHSISAKDINWTSEPEKLSDSDLVLVCVKSTGTADVARLINRYCKPEAIIISFQNGVGNADIIRNEVERRSVLSAMVGFNVVRFDDQQLRFHCATEGEIIIEDKTCSQYLVRRLNAAGIDARTDANIQDVLWGKLLLNLNNGVNVLSGLPLKRQLENRYYRKILALSIEEALKIIKSAGITPAQIGKVKPNLIPFLLRLPNFIFKVVAGGMLKIDDDARSSMWEDFNSGRPSEIDYLNGAICKLGASEKIPTPVNGEIVKLVDRKFREKNLPDIDPQELYKLVLNTNKVNN